MEATARDDTTEHYIVDRQTSINQLFSSLVTYIYIFHFVSLIFLFYPPMEISLIFIK